MPLTYTQNIPVIESIKNNRINPSMYEGNYLMSSLFGSDEQGLRLVRYAPILIAAPIISGPVAIDEPTNSTLTCSRGVVDAAPATSVTYQWRLDGVDEVGETAMTLLTTNDMDGKTATCFIRHENSEGFITSESNGIALTRIEEIVIDESELYSITGQSGKSLVNIRDNDVLLIQGSSVEDGISNFGLHKFAITGLSPEDGLVAFDGYILPITGLSQDTHENVNHLETYLIRRYEFLESMTVLNPGAESGVTDWTITAGAMESVSSESGVASPKSGSNFFYGGDDQATSEANQTITVPPAQETAIDAEEIYAGLNWFQNSYNESDEVHLWFEFLDTGGLVIGTETMYGPTVPEQQSWINVWSGLFLVPTLTRSIRVHLDFNRVSGSGNLNGYVDDISLDLYGLTLP